MEPVDSGAPGVRVEPTLAPGEVLANRYRIVSFLGQGAVGEVYQADDLELGEAVAIKILRPEIARDEQILQRFKREIQLARKVTHPNVCRVFDLVYHPAGEAGPRRVFLTMELLCGETLAERLARDGRMAPEAALPIVRQIAAALDAAHAAGVVHRDLKSSNVFLVASPSVPRAVVTDFGLAWSTAQTEGPSATLTATGELIGSPAYMAPEQVRGEDATPATDIYALGVVMYEMVTGELPFVGKSAFYTALLRLQQPPPSPRARVPDLDPGWEAAILCCLDREPTDRFRRARHVVRALGVTEASEETTTGYLPTRAYRKRRWERVRPWLAAALVTLAVGAALALLVSHRLPAAAPAPPEQAAPRPSRTTIAVLPFENLAGTPRTAYLGTSLFQMLPTELAAAEGLRPLPVEEVDRAKRDLALPGTANLSRPTLSRLRARLGADLVVTGAYLVTDQERRTRFDVLVQDTRSGETVAALSESGTEEEFLATLESLGERLRVRLGERALSPREAVALRASRPSGSESARLYAEGLASLQRSAASEARDLLTQAAAQERDNPFIRSALAAAWSQLGYDREARQEAKRAFELSAGLRREERRQIEARYREAAGEWGAAIQIYRELFDYFPDNVDYGLRLASAETASGAPRDALATLQRLRGLPTAGGDAARIALTEAMAARALSDHKLQSSAAIEAEQRARESGARSLIADAKLLLGEVAMVLGQPEQAMAAYDEAARIYASLGLRRGYARSRSFRGVLLDRQGDLPGAEDAFREALGVYRVLGDEFGLAGAVNSIAIVLLRQGRYAEARPQFEQALASFLRLGRKAAVANVLNNLGVIANSEGDQAEYEARLREVLAIQREIGDLGGEARTRVNFGWLYFHQGKLKQAQNHVDDALRLYRAVGDRSGIALTSQNRAAVMLQGGNLAEARNELLAARTLQKELGEKTNQAEAGLELSALALEQGDVRAAERWAREALELYREAGLAEREAESFAALARCRLAAGDWKQAAALLDRARSLSQGSENPRLRLFLEIMDSRVLTASGRPGDAIRVARAAARQAQQNGFIPSGFEARLSLGQAEIAAGDIPAGRKNLQDVEREARAGGFELIARKAAQALGSSARL